MATGIGMVSLGCPKNLVDSEVMLGLLKAGNFRICNDASKADAVIVNTCSFIEEAKLESIEIILRIAELKKTGKLKALIVTGCLPQRYSEIEKQLPEVDAFIGTGDFPGIAGVVEKVLAGKRVVHRSTNPRFLYTHRTPRALITPRHFAYLKISEGCDNRCSYCIIPELRGKYRSRSLNSVVSEARWLSDQGVREINLISQDLTLYGRGRYGRPRLAELLVRLAGIKPIKWIRLLYTHPAHIDPELIEIMREEEKICRYLDLPVQHINDGILNRMRRRIGKKKIISLIETLRREIPGIALRTSLIVGFPGESELQFQELLDFVRRVRFEHLGVFTYSREEGTPAFFFPGQVSQKVKKKRLRAIMSCQREIVRGLNRELLGKTVEVLIDETVPDARGKLIGRRAADAPEVDGVVFVSSRRGRPGDFLRVKITDTLEYDLVGVEVNEDTT